MQRPSAQTERTYEEPYAVQFSVFLANRVGQLRDLLAALAEAEVALRGLSIVDSSEWAVIRLVCSDPDKARALLARDGHGFTENDVILAELGDDGALARLCSLLVGAELNINFAYPLAILSRGNPVMVLHVDDHLLAVQLLRRHGVRLLGAGDLSDRA